MDPVRVVEALLDTTGTSGRSHGVNVAEVELAGGDTVIVKRGQGVGAAHTEAASLRWLAEPGEVQLPRVYAADEEWLVTERVERGRQVDPRAFGAALAGLHAAGAPAFGAQPPGAAGRAWVGEATLPVATADSWPEWYAEHRVRYYLRQAVDARAMTAADAEPVERVCARITELAGPAEAPARLHGDLWNGNVLWGRDGQAWLIDPSAHGGHRETDIAMLGLFGCPRLDEIIDGYQARWPLAEGWRERLGLHQLFPLLVHTVLFGGGYGAQARAAAQGALRP